VDAAFEGGPILEPARRRPAGRRFQQSGCIGKVPVPNGKRNPLAFTPAIVTSEFGAGRVIGFCIHPERTTGLEGWLPGASAGPRAKRAEARWFWTEVAVGVLHAGEFLLRQLLGFLVGRHEGS